MPFYLYRECGLPNVSLLNGFVLEHADGEQTVSIPHIDNLHEAIGLTLSDAANQENLTGAEIRFLRSELGFNQTNLAAKLGVKLADITAWEDDNAPMPHAAEALLRLLYREEIAPEKPDVHDFLTAFQQRFIAPPASDTRHQSRRTFRYLPEKEDWEHVTN